MKTYVFGAGASVHAGYPLASALWPWLEKWVTESLPPDHEYRSVVDQINELLDSSRPFEVVLSDLNDRILQTSDRFERVILSSLRAQTEYLMRHGLTLVRPGAAELYGLFAQRILAPQDAVITFNYDVSIDRELHRSGKWKALNGYGFVVEQADSETSSCKLLKLHGSANWIWQIFGGLRGPSAVQFGSSLGWRPAIPTPELEYLGSSLVDPIFREGTGFVPCLVMPTAHKRFYAETSFGRECEAFWDSLWLQAEYAVRSSDEVVVVGYSLPEFDQRARDLMLKSMRNDTEVSVCCRSDTKRLVELFHNSGFTRAHAAADGTFEGWANAAIRNDAA